MTDNDTDKNRENDGDQNELCDICMGRLDYIKCKYCSNKICVACITKLESLEYHYKYFTYDCCVCKKNNSLKVKDINDITDLQNIINDLSNLYRDTLSDLNDDIYMSTPVVLYYPPVVSNNDFIYCGTNIILHQTNSDNGFRALETLGQAPHISYDYVLSLHHQHSDYDLEPHKNFYYITTLQEPDTRMTITLIDKHDFNELLQHKLLRL